ncbi:CsbD family protein [Bdellovibrio sp. HCB337]|uniref:CsbD family protein n=1 Tax=Bdellovibrio sp. HCB337 TaxID=3394358 RepID=UPI0039A671C0
MNKDIFEGKFKEISGEIKKKFGELTDDEIRRTKGNAEALAGVLQQKYGRSKEDSERDVSDMLGTLERKFSPQKISDAVNEKVDQAKAKFKKS